MTKDLELEVQSRYVSASREMPLSNETDQIVHYSFGFLHPLRPCSISKLDSRPQDRPAQFSFGDYLRVGCGDDGMLWKYSKVTKLTLSVLWICS